VSGRRIAGATTCDKGNENRHLWKLDCEPSLKFAVAPSTIPNSGAASRFQVLAYEGGDERHAETPRPDAPGFMMARAEAEA
jgi:hypothetical protein